MWYHPVFITRLHSLISHNNSLITQGRKTTTKKNNEKNNENVIDIKPLTSVPTTLSGISIVASETTSSRPPGPESPRTPKSTLPEHSEELLSPTTRFSLTCHKLIKLIEDRETDEATEEVT